MADLTPWKELSPSSQKRLLRNNHGPKERAAAIKRKGKWPTLTDAYKNRLIKNGIDKKAYESGVSLQAARGHENTPERPVWALRALDTDIEEVIPLEVFWALPSGKREELGREWVLGFMTEGEHSVEQHDLRMDFLDHFDKLIGHEFAGGKEGEWARYRKAYANHFSKPLHVKKAA